MFDTIPEGFCTFGDNVLIFLELDHGGTMERNAFCHYNEISDVTLDEIFKRERSLPLSFSFI